MIQKNYINGGRSSEINQFQQFQPGVESPANEDLSLLEEPLGHQIDLADIKGALTNPKIVVPTLVAGAVLKHAAGARRERDKAEEEKSAIEGEHNKLLEENRELKDKSKIVTSENIFDKLGEFSKENEKRFQQAATSTSTSGSISVAKEEPVKRVETAEESIINEAIRRIDRSESGEIANKYNKGYNYILESNTTPAQKTLASFGKIINDSENNNISSDVRAIVNQAIINSLKTTLKDTIPGPVGLMVAKATSEATKRITDSKYLQCVQDAAFVSIRDDDSATPVEKALSRIGYAVELVNESENINTVKFGAKIIERLQTPLEGSKESIVAGTVVEALEQIKDDKSISNAMLRMFKTFNKDDSCLTPAQKSLASFGNKINDNENNNISLDVRAIVNQAIINSLKTTLKDTVPGPVGLMVAKATSEAAKRITDSKYLQCVQDAAFVSIRDDDSATPVEKALSRIGYAVELVNESENINTVKFGAKIIERLQTPLEGSKESIVAGTVVEALEQIKDDKSISNAMLRMFKTFNKDDSCLTPAQKSLASFGNKINDNENNNISLDVRAIVNQAIINSLKTTLKDTVPGPVGLMVAKATSEAAKRITNDNQLQYVQDAAFVSIRDNENASPVEKALSKIGYAVEFVSESDKINTIKFGTKIMERLQKPIEGPNSSIVTDTVFDAMEQLTDSNSINDAMKRILAKVDIDFSENQRKLVDFLVEIGNKNVKNDIKTKAMQKILKELRNDSSIILGPSLAKEAMEEARKVAGNENIINVLSSFFEIIIKDPNLSTNQKTLAEYGIDITKNENIAENTKAVANLIAMNMIKDNIQGSPGPTVAKAAFDLARSVKDKKESSFVFDVAFKVVKDDLNSTSAEKAISDFGYSVVNEDRISAGIYIMSKLMNLSPEQENFHSILADSAIESINLLQKDNLTKSKIEEENRLLEEEERKNKNPFSRAFGSISKGISGFLSSKSPMTPAKNPEDDYNFILRRAFELIKDNSSITSAQRDLAETGIQANENNRTFNEQMDIMKSIYRS
jgi:hypothetical protein